MKKTKQQQTEHEPTNEEIFAIHKTGLGSLPTGAEIPYAILKHSHFRANVDASQAETLVKRDATLGGVVLRKSSVKGQLAVTALQSDNTPIKFTISNQKLNARASLCDYYKVNMGDAIVRAIHACLSSEKEEVVEDFILKSLDQEIQGVKDKIEADQQEQAKIYINTYTDNDYKP